MPETVLVLGASPKEDRYSNKAVKLLLDYGHSVIPVHPKVVEIHGVKCQPNLSAIRVPVDTITVYLGMKNSTPLIDQIIALSPKRIVLNPGAENEELRLRARERGVDVIDGCTLVMLKSGQW